MGAKKLYLDVLSEDNDMSLVKDSFDYNYATDVEVELSPAVIQMLDERMEEIKNGTAEFISWEEMKKKYNLLAWQRR